MKVKRTRNCFLLFPLVGYQWLKDEKIIGIGWLFWSWVIKVKKKCVVCDLEGNSECNNLCKERLDDKLTKWD